MYNQNQPFYFMTIIENPLKKIEDEIRNLDSIENKISTSKLSTKDANKLLKENLIALMKELKNKKAR